MANNGPNYFWNQFLQIYDILQSQILLRYEHAKQNGYENLAAMKDELESFAYDLEHYMGINPPAHPRPNAHFFPEFYEIYTILQNVKQNLDDAGQEQGPDYQRMFEKYRDRTDGFELYLTEDLLRKLHRNEPLVGGRRKARKTRKAKRKSRKLRRR